MSNLALISNMTSVGYSDIHRINTRHLSTDKSFQVVLTGSGAVTAAVRIEVSNDGETFLYNTNSMFSLSGTGYASGGCQLVVNWEFVQVYVSSITGTDANVSVRIGS